MDNEEKKVTGTEEQELEGTENTESNEELDEESQDMDGSSQEEEEETVPLATYLELKKKYKEVRKVNAGYEEKAMGSDLASFKSTKLAEYMNLGFTEGQAEKLVSDLLDAKKEIQKQKYSQFEQNILEDIEDLQNEFEDIADYSGAIVDKIKELKRAGHVLDVADAYMLVKRNSTTRKDLRDRKVNNVQADIINKKKSLPPSNKTMTGQSSSPKNKYPLDADDKKALAALQKMQPNSKWTAEKYYKMRNG